MSTRAQSESYLTFIDFHLKEIEQRLRSLSEVIAATEANTGPTNTQSALVIKLLKAQKSMQALRTQEYDALHVAHDGDIARI